MRLKSFYQKVLKISFLNLFIAMLIISCSKDNDSELVKSSEAMTQDKISALLDKAYKSGTPEEYNAITMEYQKLSPEEFEQFLKMRTEREISKVNANNLNNRRFSNEERKSIINAITVGGAIRNDMNKLSQREFGKSFNQLEDKKILGIYSKLLKDNKLNIYLNKLGITPKSNAKIQGCPYWNYPYAAGRFNSGGSYWGGLNNVETTPGESPCDYEFVFWGKFSKIRPGNWFADRLLASWPAIKYRQGVGGLPTYVVLGWGYTTFWIGDARLTSIYMTY